MRCQSPSALACLLLAVPALSGCATVDDGTYPSLAVRDVEKAEGRFEPVPSAPLAVPEVAAKGAGSLPDRLSALERNAAAAHARFLRAAPQAERLARAAAGTAIGSPAWASAQVALADLDSLRSATAVPLADLDTLMISQAVQAEDPGAVERVRERVLGQVQAQDTTLARLRSRLR